MVVLCYEDPSQQVCAKPMAGKQNSKQFSLYVGVLGLCIHQQPAGKDNWLLGGLSSIMHDKLQLPI